MPATPPLTVFDSTHGFENDVSVAAMVVVLRGTALKILEISRCGILSLVAFGSMQRTLAAASATRSPHSSSACAEAAPLTARRWIVEIVIHLWLIAVRLGTPHRFSKIKAGAERRSARRGDRKALFSFAAFRVSVFFYARRRRRSASSEVRRHGGLVESAVSRTRYAERVSSAMGTLSSRSVAVAGRNGRCARRGGRSRRFRSHGRHVRRRRARVDAPAGGCSWRVAGTFRRSLRVGGRICPRSFARSGGSLRPPSRSFFAGRSRLAGPVLRPRAQRLLLLLLLRRQGRPLVNIVHDVLAIGAQKVALVPGTARVSCSSASVIRIARYSFRVYMPNFNVVVAADGLPAVAPFRAREL